LSLSAARSSALLVNYPLKQVLGLGKVLRKVLFTQDADDTNYIINQFVELSKKARTDGFLALENDAKNLRIDFQRRGVQMVVDGMDKDFITNLLETEIEFIANAIRSARRYSTRSGRIRRLSASSARCSG